MKAPARPCLKCGELHWGDCASARVTPKSKIIAGLRDAVAFSKGDVSKARVTTIMVESIAPPGECEYCDQRRAINAASARKRRKGTE